MSPKDYTNSNARTKLEYLESPVVEALAGPEPEAPPPAPQVKERFDAIRTGNIERFEPGSGT